MSILLYDLTSTYFEGLCLSNPKAKRGYSRDSRPDCKQVVVGLVLDAEGFPRAHEIFAGNRSDSTTVADMLSVLQKRVGKTKDATVVVDRGMANPENRLRTAEVSFADIARSEAPCDFRVENIPQRHGCNHLKPLQATAALDLQA